MLSDNLKKVQETLAHHGLTGMPMMARDARIAANYLAVLIAEARILEQAAGMAAPRTRVPSDNVVQLVPRKRATAPTPGDVA